MPGRHIDDDERRARLARRHAISPAHRLADPLAAAQAMTVLHATEAVTVHLAVAARSAASSVDVDRALYDDRTLVKQRAMLRTLFAFPRDLLPATWGSASARVAAQQRGVSTGHWRVSRPEWTVTGQWLDEVPDPLDEAEGYAVLVRTVAVHVRPGTALDLQWWLGSTASTVRRTLADVGAVEVSLDGVGVGWVLGDDVDAVAPVEDWAALLPVLDPTTMGWKERDFYLTAADTRQVFDTNGNGGSTAWWNGRIVGCWVRDDDGIVSVLAQDLPPGARAALELEGDRLTEWIDGVRIASIYASPQMKSSRLP